MRGASPTAVDAMKKFVGTQSVSSFPNYKTFRTAANIVGTIDDKRFPPPDPNSEYGLVGLIDSGTDPKNKRLQAYVVSRDVWIKTVQDNSHGSFAGGLIANARALNHGNTRFPSVGSRIVDIVAIDDSGEISEYDLITVIDRAVRKYPKVKVWNLSLGQSDPCKDGRFSLLGMKLDSISRKHGVLFVIAAGNYEQLPLRGWPPTDLGEADRICAPADSIRGLTVGSMAHIASNATCVKVDEASGFTRRGPAPHFYIKPEISHYGGNCDANADCLQSGVVSIFGSGHLGENIGTSFAAPSVSTIAANLFRELDGAAGLSPTLVKAMLVHSALVRTGRANAEDVRYKGFGSPGDLVDILNCSRSSATIVFHAEMMDRRLFEKHDFPMPTCLNIPGKGICADIYMTLAYDPPTDARYGIEYCRSNVTASLGTVERDKKTGKDKYTPQLRATPKDLTKGCEDSLISEGFKWSPLKVYHRPFESGPINKRWRLHMEILNRSGVRCEVPQKVVLIVTISDPAGKAPVYDAMLAEMQRLSWGPQDLKIASRVRQQNKN